MCKYCEEDKRRKRNLIINTPIVALRIIRNNGFNALAIKSYNLEKQVVDSYQTINYCPKCRKEAGRVTIREYIFKNNISYRQLAKQLGISHTYLYDLSKSKRKTISEEVANRFKAIAPEIGVMVETKKYYRIR